MEGEIELDCGGGGKRMGKKKRDVVNKEYGAYPLKDLLNPVNNISISDI